MILEALLLFSSATQVPALPSFDEIQKGMANTYQSYADYADSWELRWGSNQMTYGRKLDRGRYRLEVSAGDRPLMLEVWDGNTGMSVNHAVKQYKRWHVPPTYKTEPESLQPGQLNVVASGPYSFVVSSNPTPHVVEMKTVTLEGREARRVIALVEVGDAAAPKTMYLWFEKDHWALRKAVMVSGDGELQSTQFLARTTKVHRDAKLGTSDFTVDPTVLAGYKDVTDGG